MCVVIIVYVSSGSVCCLVVYVCCPCVLSVVSVCCVCVLCMCVAYMVCVLSDSELCVLSYCACSLL